ncbi:hypothetical protein DPEC_G00101580 [Dallia pectoralis]|uniref:Uncharacterized protein n=1 Tax=Dallia pectoralis TaxID=75939 RepID=A0ACC2GWV1_DALPE|nr:hypothetical protein DPEC_G00101580 [Dallia pectoralis]
MNRLQRKLMPMQNTLYLIPTAKWETYPISLVKREVPAVRGMPGSVEARSFLMMNVISSPVPLTCHLGGDPNQRVTWLIKGLLSPFKSGTFNARDQKRSTVRRLFLMA